MIILLASGQHSSKGATNQCRCGQAVLFKKNRARAYAFLAAVLVAMHGYILYATASYKLSTCDQLTTNPSYGMW